MPLNEYEKRRPDFQEGVWVTLADGQDWMFRTPTVQLKPKALEDGSYGFTRAISLGPSFRELLDKVMEADPDEGIPMSACLNLAIPALRLNYDLTDDELADLLIWEPDSPASEEMWGKIIGASTGTYKGKALATG